MPGRDSRYDRMCGLALAAVAAGICVLTPAEAPAAPAPVQVQWTAPERCPTEQEFVGTVERLLGGELGSPGRAAMTASVSVTARSGRFELTLRTRTPEGEGERRLADASCDLLAEAAALMVALAIDPVAVLQEGDETGAVQVTPEPSPSDTPSPPESTPRSMRVALRVLGGGEWGSLPGVGAGVAAAVGLVWPRVRGELVGHYWLARPARYGDPTLAGVGGDLRLGAAALRVCPTPRVKRTEFPICAGLEVGAMVGKGVGVEGARTRRAVWAAAQAGPAVAWWPSEYLGLWLEVDAVVPFVRPAFVVEGAGRTLHRAEVAGVRGFVGAEVRFR